MVEVVGDGAGWDVAGGAAVGGGVMTGRGAAGVEACACTTRASRRSQAGRGTMGPGGEGRGEGVTDSLHNLVTTLMRHYNTSTCKLRTDAKLILADPMTTTTRVLGREQEAHGTRRQHREEQEA